MFIQTSPEFRTRKQSILYPQRLSLAFDILIDDILRSSRILQYALQLLFLYLAIMSFMHGKLPSFFCFFLHLEDRFVALFYLFTAFFGLISQSLDILGNYYIVYIYIFVTCFIDISLFICRIYEPYVSNNTETDSRINVCARFHTPHTRKHTNTLSLYSTHWPRTS